MRRTLGILWLSLLAVLLVSVSGCGRQDGPPRYRVTGTVTYDGQPIPSGNVIFLPDASKGNDGPGGAAQIVDGKFDTKSGEHPIGGPQRVMIEGVKENPKPGLLPTSLFPSYTKDYDLPKEDTTLNIDVPKGGGSGI